MKRPSIRSFLLAAAVMLLIPISASAAGDTNTFEDTKQHWARDSIEWCYEKGIVNGVSASSFCPDAEVTRASFVTMLYRFDGKKATQPDALPFADCLKSTYYYDAVAWAYQNEIVHGVSSTAFNPEAYITLEDVATILHRYCKTYDLVIPEINPSADFADKECISGYARAAMQWAYRCGLLSEDRYGANASDPKHMMLRGELAAVLRRLSLEEAEVFNINSSEVTKIAIRNSNNGRYTEITDADQITAFVEALNGFHAIETQYPEPFAGYSYYFIIYTGNEDTPSFSATIMSPCCVYLDSAFHLSMDLNSLSFEWIDSFFTTASDDLQ